MPISPPWDTEGTEVFEHRIWFAEEEGSAEPRLLHCFANGRLILASLLAIEGGLPDVDRRTAV